MNGIGACSEQAPALHRLTAPGLVAATAALWLFLGEGEAAPGGEVFDLTGRKINAESSIYVMKSIVNESIVNESIINESTNQ